MGVRRWGRWAVGAALVWAMLVWTMLPGAALGEGAVLHRGNTGAVTSVDPHRAVGHYEAHVLRDLYDGLVIRGPDGGVLPGAAGAWQVSRGGTVYTFRLDPLAAWSDGTAVTAADFVRSLRRAVDPAEGAPHGALLAPIDGAAAILTGAAAPTTLGVAAPDDTTVEITLAAPASYLLDRLTHPIAMPVAADIDGADRPATNGAFRLLEMASAGPLVLARNPHHPVAAEIVLDQVVYHATPDRAAALAAFQTGALHINNDVPVERIGWLLDAMPVEFRRHPWLAVEYYALALDQPPWDDPALRRALWQALNRAALAGEAMGGAAFAADRLVPPGIDWYDAVADDRVAVPAVAAEGDDPAAALIEAFAAAGYGPENPVALDIRVNDVFHHLQVARAVGAMWRPLGVDVSLTVDDTAAHFRHLGEGGAFQVARAGWVADTRDPQAILGLFRCPGDPPLPAPGNPGGYCNPAVDDRLDRAAATRDPAARARLLAEVETLILADMPLLPLFHHASLNLVSTAVTGWQDNVMDVHPSRFLGLDLGE